jgi:hypothetical protein
MLNQGVNIKRNHDFISKVKDITKWLKNLKIQHIPVNACYRHKF